MNTHVKPPTAEVAFATALVQLQADIRPAIKDTENGAFKGRKYADLGAVWEAVKAPLKTHGFAVVQMPQFEGTTMYLETILLHESGEKMTGRYPLNPSKPDPQGYGSAITYARRYAICAMLGVIADDDDDGNAASGVSSNGNHKPALAAPAPAPDQDQIDGVANWVGKQKTAINACATLPALYGWLEQIAGAGGTISDPDSSSPLDRLKRKATESYGEIVQAFQKRLMEINKKANQ